MSIYLPPVVVVNDERDDLFPAIVKVNDEIFKVKG